MNVAEGPHYALYNADALEVLKFLPTAYVDAVVTDPPYSSGGMFRSDRINKPSDKYQNSETVKSYSEFMGDNRDQRAYAYWSALWMSETLRVTKPGGWMFCFTDWRQLPTTTDAIQAGGWVWRGIIPWSKTEAARPSRGRFRAQCEYVLWASNGEIPEGPEIYPAGFFIYPIIQADKFHVTGKPSPLMRDLLQVIPPRSKVLDPFMGSGTTISAGLEIGMGHTFVGIEKSPQIFDEALERIRLADGTAPMFAVGPEVSQGALL